jgi:hypothetical protein
MADFPGFPALLRIVTSAINEVGESLSRHLAEGVACLSGPYSLGGGSCTESSTHRWPYGFAVAETEGPADQRRLRRDDGPRDDETFRSGGGAGNAGGRIACGRRGGRLLRGGQVPSATLISFGSPGPSSGPCTGSSPTRSPHHGHDPSPDGIGQAVPDGGQLGHLGRDRLGLNEARRSLGLGGCGSGYVPAMHGTAWPPPHPYPVAVRRAGRQRLPGYGGGLPR